MFVYRILCLLLIVFLFFLLPNNKADSNDQLPLTVIAEGFLLSWYPMLNKDLKISCTEKLTYENTVSCQASGYDTHHGRQRIVQMKCDITGCYMSEYETTFRKYIASKYGGVKSVDIRCSDRLIEGYVTCGAMIYIPKRERPEYERVYCNKKNCKENIH